MNDARALLTEMHVRQLRLAMAESCTGGLIAGLLTECPGASDVVERGFVTYSDAAKTEQLGVGADVIARHGAVSAAVALAMAEGALVRSHAHVAVSVTGIAGPGGGTPQKPVGLIYMATAMRGTEPKAARFTFPDHGRQSVRLSAVAEALRLIKEAACGV